MLSLKDQLTSIAKPSVFTPCVRVPVVRRKRRTMKQLMAIVRPELSMVFLASSMEIGKKLKLSRASTYNILVKLEENGEARRSGAGRTTKWFLTQKGKENGTTKKGS